MLVLTVAIFLVSLVLVDPWIWLIAGIMALVLGREMVSRNDQNLGLISSLAFTTVIALMLALLFNFYVDDLGYRLKEIGVAVACLSTAFAVVILMTSHTRLEMNKGMAMMTTLFVSLFLMTSVMLTLLLFDALAGNTLIIDNRWMMFIVTDISVIILVLWLVMVYMKDSIPFDGTGGRST
jgi:hypothetical protein